MSLSSDGIRIKKENFKALKDEISNITNNINEVMINLGVYTNSKDSYIWRAKHKKREPKSILEQRYELNEIVKYSNDLDKNKYLQGFTNKYFRDLTDLLSKNKKKYSKERIDLFNTRIKNSHKTFIDNLKKYSDVSIINNLTNLNNNHPILSFMTGLNSCNNSKKTNLELDKIRNNIFSNKYCNLRKVFSTNNISIFPFNYYKKRIVKIKQNNNYNFNEKEKYIKSNKDNNFNKRKILTKYRSYQNLLTNKNNKIKTKNISDYISSTNRKNNSNDNSIGSNSNEKGQIFFKHLEYDEYINYLKSQYNFYDYYIDKNEKYFQNKTQRRKQLYNLIPNSDFLNKMLKDGCKLNFFNRIEREKNKDNTSNLFMSKTSSAKDKKRIRIKKYPIASSRLLKKMKFKNDCKLMYNKYINNVTFK